MSVTRRDLLFGAGATALAQALPNGRTALAQGHDGHTMPAAPAERAQPHPTAASEASYVPVRTLNGWTLPHRMVNGVKEFHLVAEEIVHEFAPGSKATGCGFCSPIG